MVALSETRSDRQEVVPMMNGYAMSGWGWLLMTLGMLGFWALVAVVAVALLRHPGQPDQQPPPGAQEILAQRLARGELDPEEYRQRSRPSRRPPTGPDPRHLRSPIPGCRGSAQPLSLANSSGRSASCCRTMGPSIGS